MKKLKLRGRELKRLGYTDDRAINLALNIVKKKIKAVSKVELLETLQDILYQPGKYKQDKYFGELANILIESPDKTNQKENQIRKQPLGYAVYGRQFIDSQTLDQMETAMKMPVVVKGALMADAHLGYGLPIGGVVATYNSVMPYGVGMDIGCRMCMSVYDLNPDILVKKKGFLKNILIENTRFGHAEFNDLGDVEIMERKELREIKFVKAQKDNFYRQLGTSGHGNHFVDIGYVEITEKTKELGLEPEKYFAILSHSGSRNFGAEVAKHYTAIAKNKANLTGEAAKLAWLELDTEEGQEYWAAMNLAGDYSAANHHIIHDKLSKSLGEKPVKQIENHHNFAWKEKLTETENLIVHRKGATPAHKGNTGIIPGNMVSPAYIISGKGNEESLCSASHGAGRVISRRKAKKTFSRKDMEYKLKKAGIELIGGNLDEAPMAYKKIEQVMEAQKELVNTLGKFYPKIVRME